MQVHALYDAQTPPEQAEEYPPPPKKQAFVLSLVEEVVSDGPEDESEAGDDPEWQKYAKHADRRAQGSLLQWWKENDKVYPRMAMLARRMLACQATSAASERVFSRSGALASKTRNRMTDRTLNMLTFLKDNEELCY